MPEVRGAELLEGERDQGTVALLALLAATRDRLDGLLLPATAPVTVRWRPLVFARVRPRLCEKFVRCDRL